MDSNELRATWKDIRKNLGNLISNVDTKLSKLEQLDTELDRQHEIGYQAGYEDGKILGDLTGQHKMYHIAKTVLNMSVDDKIKYFDKSLSTVIFNSFRPEEICERIEKYEKEKEEAETTKPYYDEVVAFIDHMQRLYQVNGVKVIIEKEKT